MFKTALRYCSFLCLVSLAHPALADPYREISLRGDKSATLGIFDPSLTTDSSGALWMSYSSVRPDPTYGAPARTVSTRLAVSRDHGQSWKDQGVISASTPQPLPFPHHKLHAKWQYEVARLVYDPYAPEPTRWKAITHRYLSAYDGHSPDAARLFEHGWMELRTAAQATGPWSDPRKIFVGSGYNKNNDNTIGKPEYKLNTLHQDMRSCVAFTEPGMLARPSSLYIALTCHTGKDSRVILMGCSHDVTSCEYKGTLLTAEAAQKINPDLLGFSGTDLTAHQDQPYLIATPTRQPGDIYQGCVFYKILDLEKAVIEPVPSKRVYGDANSFNGACGYTGDDIYLSQFQADKLPLFRIMSTGLSLTLPTTTSP